MRTIGLSNTPVHPELDYSAFCQCANQCSGNFYEFIPQSSSRLVVSVGDLPATGHASCLNIPGLQALIRGLTAGSRGDLAGLARDLNGTLYLLGPEDHFASWFYALVDPVRHELQYVNAGHEPPFLIHKRTGRVQRLERTGAALGLSTRGTYQHETTAMEPGDLLVVFSEGVAATLSDAAVVEIVLRHPDAGAAELTRMVFEEATQSANRPWLDEDRTFAAVRLLEANRQPLPHEFAQVGELVCAA